MTVVTGIVQSTTSTTPSSPLGMNIQAQTPNVETGAYLRNKERWTKGRDLMLGAEAIRAGGTKYLPQMPNEDDDRYLVRKDVAALFNGYARTVQATVGIVLSEEPTLGDDMPKKIVTMWENVDGAGMHGAVFTRKLLTAAMVDAIAGIVTEYPRAGDPRLNLSKASAAAQANPEKLDAADESAIGLAPYFMMVKADNLLLPLYETINGKKTLVMLILRYYVTERVAGNRFGFVNITRYRVYYLEQSKVMFEQWTATAGTGAPEIDKGFPVELKNISAIPWSPLVTGEEIGDNEYKPPLQDLADLNLEHHNVKTGIRSLENLAFVPTPVRIGVVPTVAQDGTKTYPPLVLGPSNTIEVPAMQGVTTPFYWSSPDIAVLDPANRSLENITGEMGAMGATFLAPQKRATAETATASRLDAAGERATIVTVARATQDCLESACGFAAEYIGEKGGSVAVCDDFTGEGLNSQYIAVIVSAYQQGAIDIEELRYVLQNGQLPEDFDATDVVALLANQKAKEDQKRLDAQTALAQNTNANANATGGTPDNNAPLSTTGDNNA